jgi:predicted  nucleic acid-binding Zn-ribbon protein
MKEKLARYKSQQLAVRTNKEYDALTREMDHAETSIVRLEKEMEAHESAATRARTEIEDLRVQVAAIEEELQGRRTELAAVTKETEDEELRYAHERKKLVVRVSKDDLARYERIRKAKKGKAVVPVKRGACGGCFKQVPPQTLLELRQNKKLFICEHCGRIIVSNEIVEATASVA